MKLLMDNSLIISKLEEIFSDLLPSVEIPAKDISKLNCAQWDSLFQLNLILTLEQEFEITISDEEATDLTSFNIAQELVADLCQAKTAS